MKKIQDGELSLDTKLKIEESDKVEPYELFYKGSNDEVNVKELLEKMLKSSDNTGIRVLSRQIQQDELRLILDYYGINITSTAKIQLKDYVTPKSMYTLFSSLYFSSVLNQENSDYLLSLLTNTVLNINRFADLPDEVIVAHKFG